MCSELHFLHCDKCQHSLALLLIHYQDYLLPCDECHAQTQLQGTDETDVVWSGVTSRSYLMSLANLVIEKFPKVVDYKGHLPAITGVKE